MTAPDPRELGRAIRRNGGEGHSGVRQAIVSSQKLPRMASYAQLSSLDRFGLRAYASHILAYAAFAKSQNANPTSGTAPYRKRSPSRALLHSVESTAHVSL